MSNHNDLPATNINTNPISKTATMSQANTLMLTYVIHTFPTSTHHAYVCSAGSKGYHALKEMLQNGRPGNTLLLESGDLRDVGSSNLVTSCCLLHDPSTSGADGDDDDEDAVSSTHLRAHETPAQLV
eukprot:TRINITY_DN53370_c0_g1_i1.p1 TRINITY_DN53370_c0_g1~~TRINITY_DN53370_c0_g1_i1.p1  ORF type:complete len:127 (+),score=31.57 TRINITY_DN53370_c0_g1_i1:274-654(+)